MEREKFQELNALSPEIQAAKDKLSLLMRKFNFKTDPALAEKLHNEIFNFSKELQAAFPDNYFKYSAYHMLIGSSVDSKPEFFDFINGKNGDKYSVIKFIDGLEAKITENK